MLLQHQPLCPLRQGHPSAGYAAKHHVPARQITHPEQIGFTPICSFFNAAGNGFTVGHNYDSLDRETSRSYNGTTKFYWTYNADGNLARYSENGNRVLTYLYDDIGRLLQVSGNDGSYVKTSYDKLDKSTDLHYKFNGQRRDVYFHYSDKDNLPLDVKFGTGTAYAVTLDKCALISYNVGNKI